MNVYTYPKNQLMIFTMLSKHVSTMEKELHVSKTGMLAPRCVTEILDCSEEHINIAGGVGA